jgi:hypothetical protein
MSRMSIHTLQHEAAILRDLDSMVPYCFQTELQDSLISLCEGIIELPCAGGRPKAKNIKH